MRNRWPEIAANVDYDESFQPVPWRHRAPGDAGHILGSASIELEVEEHGRKENAACGSRAILAGATCPCCATRCCQTKIDYLVMECNLRR